MKRAPAPPIMRTQLVQRGAEETARFTAALRNIEHKGLRTPCSDVEISHWWLSEEPTERRRAVSWCRGCPVIADAVQLR
jgi:hypothetical protein